MICGETYCKNNYNKSIYAKPEKGETPIEIPENKDLYNIDGIKVDGKLYKCCDGTHIIVEKDGSIKNTSVIGKIFNTVRGGYKTKALAENWEKLEEI